MAKRVKPYRPAPFCIDVRDNLIPCPGWLACHKEGKWKCLLAVLQEAKGGVKSEQRD